MDTKQHLTVVAALNIGLGALGLVLGIIAFVVLAGIGLLSGDADAMPILTFIAFIAGGFLLITSVPDIIGGIGLAKRQSWARILVLILQVDQHPIRNYRGDIQYLGANAGRSGTNA